MGAKVASLQQNAVEEVFVQNEAVSLCVLIHRRARIMRVIDFRAGPTSAKRDLVMSTARREGVQKVFTLVERDEVQTWQKLGFSKEGTIPGFYKRSDALLLGSAVSSEGAAVEEGGEVPYESEMRIIVAKPAAGGASPSPSHEQAEETIATAKKGLKAFEEKARLGPVKWANLTEADARKAVALAERSGRALTAFERFGRDVQRRYFVAVARGGFKLVTSTETQTCFGNAYIEFLQSPRSEGETHAAAAALRSLCDRLLSEETLTCFSLAPSDDVALASVFLHNGFRRTGLLLNHLACGVARRDAIVWSRKLAVAPDE